MIILAVVLLLIVYCAERIAEEILPRRTRLAPVMISCKGGFSSTDVSFIELVDWVKMAQMGCGHVWYFPLMEVLRYQVCLGKIFFFYFDL